MRNRAGANAWRKVEGVMGDIRISRKLKRTVLSSCVTPLDTTALTEKQQKIQVHENNLVGRIMEFKKADKRTMNALRVEVGMKDSFKKKLVKSWLTRPGHVERMGDEKLAESTESGGERKRGRPKL